MAKIAAGFRIKIPRPPTARIPNPLARILVQKKEEPPYGQPPPDFMGGSLAEWAIAWALTSLHIEFEMQVNRLGGRRVAGGAVVDFLIPAYNLIIRVQGVYFHYERGLGKDATDEIQKIALEALGYVVIDIDENDALRAPIYYTQEALRGIDHSRSTIG